MTFDIKAKFVEAQELLSGSCLYNPQQVMRICEIPFQFEEEFLAYLDAEEVIECESCGWWTYPLTPCDCKDLENDDEDEDN